MTSMWSGMPLRQVRLQGQEGGRVFAKYVCSLQLRAKERPQSDIFHILCGINKHFFRQSRGWPTAWGWGRSSQQVSPLTWLYWSSQGCSCNAELKRQVSELLVGNSTLIWSYYVSTASQQAYSLRDTRVHRVYVDNKLIFNALYNYTKPLRIIIWPAFTDTSSCD